MRGLGVARVVLVGAAGAGLVFGAGQVPVDVDLSPLVAADTPASASSARATPVSERGLLCPGPERLGAKGGLEDEQSVRAVAAAAPDAVVPAGERPGAPSRLTVRRLPGHDGSGKAQERHRAVVDTPDSLLFVAAGRAAPGAAGLQYSLVRSGNHRGLSTVACGGTAAEAWLVAGGAQPGRLEHVVLVNPAANAVTVDLEVLGAHGPVESDGGSGLLVPPHGRTVVLLDSLASSEQTPVVHVTAHGGEVYAAIEDGWLDGVVPRGTDTSTTTAPPSREQVIAGVKVDGPTTLRVAVPGEAEAVVQTRVLTTKGPRRVKHDVVRIPGHTVRDIDLSDLPTGSYAVQVRADVKVVASALVQRGRSSTKRSAALDRTASDLTWSPSSPVIDGVAGSPLPPPGQSGTKNWLLLGNTGARAKVDVTTVDRRGKVTSRTVTVAADAVSPVDLRGAHSVWVQPRGGAVYGAVLTQARAKDGDGLSAVLPLVSAPLTSTTTPIRPAS